MESLFNQDITYWEYNGIDGYKSVVYKSPQSFKGRWQDKVEAIYNNDFDLEIKSSAIIYTAKELKKEGRVSLGVLDDNAPEKDSTRIIKGVQKTPSLKNNKTLFKVFLQ